MSHMCGALNCSLFSPVATGGVLQARYPAEMGCNTSSVVRALLFGSLGLGRCPSLPASLLLLNDWDRSRDELNTTVAAVGSCVQLAVVVEVVLTVELVLSTKLAGETVGSFSMITVTS